MESTDDSQKDNSQAVTKGGNVLDVDCFAEMDWTDMRNFDNIPSSDSVSQQTPEITDGGWFEEEERKMNVEFGKFIRVTCPNDIMDYKCEICQIHSNSKRSLEIHCNGMKHLKKKKEWDDKNEASSVTAEGAIDFQKKKTAGDLYCQDESHPLQIPPSGNQSGYPERGSMRGYSRPHNRSREEYSPERPNNSDKSRGKGFNEYVGGRDLRGYPAARGRDSREYPDARGKDSREYPDARGRDSREYPDARDRGSREYSDMRGRGSHEHSDERGRGFREYSDVRGRGSREYSDVRGRGSREFSDVRGRGSREFSDVRGRGSREYPDMQGRGSYEYDDIRGKGSNEYHDTRGRGRMVRRYPQPYSRPRGDHSPPSNRQIDSTSRGRGYNESSDRPLPREHYEDTAKVNYYIPPSDNRSPHRQEVNSKRSYWNEDREESYAGERGSNGRGGGRIESRVPPLPPSYEMLSHQVDKDMENTVSYPKAAASRWSPEQPPNRPTVDDILPNRFRDYDNKSNSPQTNVEKSEHYRAPSPPKVDLRQASRADALTHLSKIAILSGEDAKTGINVVSSVLKSLKNYYQAKANWKAVDLLIDAELKIGCVAALETTTQNTENSTPKLTERSRY